VSTAALHAPVAPRWRTLAWLSLGVLVVHLYLLSGGWPNDLGIASTAPAASGTDAATPSGANGEAATTSTEAPVPLRVTSSRVRWIVPPPPAPAQPVEPLVEARPPRPRPQPAPAVPPPLPEPEPEPAALVRNDAPPPVEDPSLDPMLATGPSPENPMVPPEPAAPDPAVSNAEPAAAQPSPPMATPTVRPPTASATAPAPPQEALQADTVLPPAQAAASMRLMYEVTGRVKGINYNASGSLDWQNEGSRYQARMAVRAFLAGSREQTSAGTLGATGLVPERFTDKSRTERAALFDAGQRRIRFSSNAPESPWVAGGQDRLGVFMQLAALLQARPDAYPPGSMISLQVAGPGDAEVWRFEIGAEETLALPAGEMRARLVKRTPRKPQDTRTELWLAPQLQHLPVRIRITQHNGDHIEQSLRYMP
jgi:hypothetical protein